MPFVFIFLSFLFALSLSLSVPPVLAASALFLFPLPLLSETVALDGEQSAMVNKETKKEKKKNAAVWLDGGPCPLFTLFFFVVLLSKRATLVVAMQRLVSTCPWCCWREGKTACRRD